MIKQLQKSMVLKLIYQLKTQHQKSSKSKEVPDEKVPITNNFVSKLKMKYVILLIQSPMLIVFAKTSEIENKIINIAD